MRGRIIMERITGRIINKFKNKEYDIFIIHNTKEYRFLIDREKINVKNYSIGDIVECTGNNFVGDFSDEYSEYFCDKIKMIKQTLLTTNECAISNQNKFNGTKERIYFHTKMITDKNCIKKMFVFDNVLKSIRKNLESRCFLECRTPILNDNYLGGTSLSYETYVNYKHKINYLRPNSIFPLSMFLAGGLNRVYEFGEYFRNGSISKMHSSPYLAIEIYATDIDYKSMIEFAKEIYIDVLNSLNEKLQYNFSANLKVISFEMFMSQNEYKDFSINNLNEYFKFKNYNFSNDNYENINNLYKIFKENIMPRFQGAYLITDLPAGISPLIDSLNNNENILKRSLLFLNGYTIMEIAYCSNDYSVIKNGIEKQLAYLERREKNCKKGGVMFEGYAHALKLGILPMSYISISVERFIALLCNNKFITENMIDI